ncbi:MAG: tetratricopeptide repeat protein [Gemmatimonadota bacterium]
MTTRHPTARRVHRQNAAPDDVFVAGVLESSVWAQQHGRKLLIGAVIAAVLIAAATIALMNRSDRRAEAAAQLNQVRAVAMSGNAQLAIRELEQFVEQYGGTPAATEAKLLLGNAYFKAGRHEQAATTVEPLTDDLETIAGVNAAFLLAAAHEAADTNADAEAVYLRIAEDARFLFQRQDALDNAARMRLQNGDAAGAAALYDQLLEITPINSPERQIYQLRLGEAQAAAATGNTAGASVPPTAGAAAGTVAAPAQPTDTAR